MFRLPFGLRSLFVFLLIPTLSPRAENQDRLKDLLAPQRYLSNSNIWQLREPRKSIVEFRAEEIAVKLLSWHFLLDASEDNPFRSEALLKLSRENPACIRRIYVQLIESGLDNLSEAEASSYLGLLSRNYESDPRLMKPVILKGTESYLLNQQSRYLTTQISETLRSE